MQRGDGYDYGRRDDIADDSLGKSLEHRRPGS
jgi:hypothetical protein